MIRPTPLVLAVVLSTGFLGGAVSGSAAAGPVADTALAPAVPTPAYMDTTCSPCRDFYRFANGKWSESAEIPSTGYETGVNYEMENRNQAVLKRILEKAAADADQEQDPTLQKMGWLYRLLMDSTRADHEGTAPIADVLQRIDGLRTKDDLCREFARLDAATPFNFGPEADPKQSRMSIANLTQGGLGLPERDYYLRTDAQSDSMRRNYVAHVARTLALLGSPVDQAQADAARVMKLETALAESSFSAVELRDPDATYHKMTVKELQALAPAVNWPLVFDGLEVMVLSGAEAKLDVSEPSFIRQVSRLVESTPIEDWRAYMRYHRTQRAMPWLGQAAFAELFSYVSMLTGQESPRPRWRRAAGAVDAGMGEALGKAYVETEFPPSSKAKMCELVDNLRLALRERIESRPWMSDETKKKAVKKLEAMTRMIGYPDKWRDYSKLRIDPRDSAYKNMERAVLFEQRRQLAKIGLPVDRTEWGMTPPTLNAYYAPWINQIVFPAGYLQPPEFDPMADDAANYGAVGATIGHEMTHGFDDEGRKFDDDGNLADWWTKEDANRFEERTEQLVQQYKGYVAVDTLHVNGKLTLGENTADLGGLIVAYRAWKLSQKGKTEPPPTNGWTPDQRFFLAYAQAWRQKYRPEMMRLITLSDPHCVPYWRVNGVVKNMPEFSRAFHCQAKDAMAQDPGRTVEIW